MSELKAFEVTGKALFGRFYTKKVYDKDEADKVLANRDYEINKLKDSIGRLLKAKTEQVIHEIMQKALIYGEGFVRVEDAMKLIAEIRHNKYKRCCNEAKICQLRLERYEQYVTKYKNCNGPTIQRWRFLKDHYEKWYTRWFKITEKFNPNSTATKENSDG